MMNLIMDLLVYLVVQLLIWSSRLIEANDYYRDLTFASAQCQAICMKQYELQGKIMQRNCINSCGKMPNFCEDDCKKQDNVCLTGCKILQNVLQVHPGNCPSSGNDKVIRSASFARQPSCLAKCKTDYDCYQTQHKCCISGCSSLCVKPIYNASIPALAPKLQPTFNSTELEFEWLSQYKNFIENKNPITFILQTRVCTCKIFDPLYADKWQTLIITTQSGARLNAFDPGKTYQFRLAAVSRYGTRGYGPPSNPFPVDVDRPQPPQSPRRVRELLTRIYSNGDISVSIGWDKPQEHLLPISEYVVKWMIDYGYVQSNGQAMSALTQFTQPIPPDRLSYVLENLNANTSYRVELYSKTYWPGDKPLISSATSFFITTPAINSNTSPELQYLKDDKCQNITTLDFNGQQIASISAPIYDDNGLKVSVKILNEESDSSYIIQWTPKICIDQAENQMTDKDQRSQELETKSKYFHLKSLHFNCRYHISIQKVKSRHLQDSRNSLNDMSQFSEGYFCIPSCFILNKAKCDDLNPLTNPPPQPIELLSKPLKNDVMSYQLTWKNPYFPKTEMDNLYIMKYRVIWGPRIYEPVRLKLYRDIPGLNPILDSSKSLVKVINKNQNQFVLRNLQPDTLYIIKLQLLVTMRDGQQSESDSIHHYIFTDSESSNVFAERKAAYKVSYVMNYGVVALMILLTQILLHNSR